MKKYSFNPFKNYKNFNLTPSHQPVYLILILGSWNQIVMQEIP